MKKKNEIQKLTHTSDFADSFSWQHLVFIKLRETGMFGNVLSQSHALAFRYLLGANDKFYG